MASYYLIKKPFLFIELTNKIYDFIIFHRNGAIELAIQKGQEFHSGITTEYSNYVLSNETYYDVKVSKVLDEISFRVNGKEILSFSTGPDTSEILFSSEQSTSRFSEIQIKKRDVHKFFAIRKAYSTPGFNIEDVDPNKTILTVSNATSDYIVVVQYLYTPLRRITTRVDNVPITANIFFSGWIILFK